MTIFVVALLLRFLLFMFVLSDRRVIFQPDSAMYTSLAEGIRQHGSFCYPKTPDTPDVERVPGYPVFLYLMLSISKGNYLAVVAVQIIIDALTCVLIGILGGIIWENAFLISGLLASINLNMIVYSHFILSDSLFLSFFVGLLILMFKFMKSPSFLIGALIMVGFGLLSLLRPVVLYMSILIIPFIILRYRYYRKDNLIKAILYGLLWGLLFIAIISPWMYRNYKIYNKFALSAQTGQYLLHYIVPFVWQYSRGIPFIEGMKNAIESFNEQMVKLGKDPAQMDPFERSALETEIAFDFLQQAPKTAVLKAWLFGIAKNLFSPALVDLSYLLKIERPHFFYTEGKTLLERAGNFIRNMPGLFGWFLCGSLAGTALMRLIQLWGLVVCLKRDIWKGSLMVILIGYFLAVSGPIGYAKYRLPFEPILIILLAIGAYSIAKGLPLKNRKPSSQIKEALS